MPRYVRFEKKTSRGTLEHDVAIDGLILRQRSRRGINKKTGKVAGGRGGSATTYGDETAVRTAFEKRVKELLAERFVQVGGPPIASPPPPAAKARSKGLLVEGRPKPATKAEMAAFEAKHGISLPATYRRFTVTYGAGDLLGFVRIHTPRAKGRQRLASLVKLADDGALFPFADTAGGDLLGWRLPSEAVYILERTDERPRKVAADFDAFVRGLTTNQRFVEKLFPDLDADATFTAR